VTTIDGRLLTYLSVTVVLAATPGATTAVVVRNALAGGRRAGYVAAAGAATGNLTQAAAAGLGLSILLRRLPFAETLLSGAGAAYLTWLGLMSARRALRVHEAARMDRVGRTVPAFRQGLTVNLLNPSIATFYLVVVPGFVDPAAGTAGFARLAAMHVVIAFGCHAAWATAFDRLKAMFARPAFARTLDALTALALFALAIRIVRAALGDQT
jgi:threonine/homoserine/homoserine lactone efflux protein